MDVEKIINDFEETKETKLVDNVEYFITELDRMKDVIIKNNDELNLGLNSKTLASDIDILKYHSALYIKSFNDYDVNEQIELYNNLKQTFNYYEDCYKKVLDLSNKAKVKNEKKTNKNIKTFWILVGISLGLMLLSVIFFIAGSGKEKPYALYSVGIAFLSIGAVMMILDLLLFSNFTNDLSDNSTSIKQSLKEKSDLANKALLNLVALDSFKK
ncbi:MAG: hypothetical protein J6Y28_03400 [Acholeplasmatales bacterium]|nr:hypothetical protein [Acholeplasmatales bacterium]